MSEDIVVIESAQVDVVQEVTEVTIQIVEQPLDVTVETPTTVVETSVAVTELAPGLTQRAEAVSSTLAYVGEAEPGSLPSEDRWRIRRIQEQGSGLTVTTWAESDSGFVHAWDDRAGYVYG
jgi:hypothetical protein